MAIKQSTIGIVGGTAFFAMSAFLGGSAYHINKALQEERNAILRQKEFKQLGIDLGNASDFQTNAVRQYVVTTDRTYLDSYWKEIDVTKTRDRVLSRLKEMG